MKERHYLFEHWGLDRDARNGWKDEVRQMSREKLLDALVDIYHDLKRGKIWDWSNSWLAVARMEARRRGLTENDVIAHYTLKRLMNEKLGHDD